MRRILCSLAIVGSVSVLHASQEPGAKAVVRPDFSGTWTLGPVNPVIGGRGNSPDGQLRVSGPAQKLEISQDAGKLRIEEHRLQYFQPMNTVEYLFDGQPVQNPFLAENIHHAPSETRSRWEENKLVSTIDVFVPRESEPRRYVETLSINAEGILAVRIQRVGTPDSRTMFYRKTK